MPIEIKDLGYTYMPGTPFEKEALKGVDLTVADGELLGIIGHTGSGKSTLISHMNALVRPMRGTVLVNGIDTRGKDMRAVRRSVGLVFQYPEYQLFEETVEKDVGFAPRMQGRPPEEISAVVRAAVRDVGLSEDLLSRSPFELSGGQKRRVAIAGVLAAGPDILVLDEPAAGLDPAGRRAMLDLIRSLHDGGRTCVMVSHSMEDVGLLCTRIAVLRDGRIALSGTPREVFLHEEELREAGLSVPECATLARALARRGFEMPEGAYTMEEVADAIARRFGKGDADA